MLKVLLSGSLLLGAVASETPAAESSHLPPTGLRLASRSQLRRLPNAEMPYSGARLPLRVDLSESMPRPGYQGKQNSCAAWASAYAVKTYQEKIEGHYSLFLRNGQMDPHKIFSPAFVYNQIPKKKNGDTGISLFDALNLLRDRGAVTLADMPYNMDDYRRQPTKEQLRKASVYRIASFSQLKVRNLQEQQASFKAQLQAGYPIMVAANVDQSLDRLRPGMIWQHSAGRPMGPHALVLVGYDDGRNAYKLMNSWGPGWSDHGFGWVDYKQLSSVLLEAYTAKDAPNKGSGRMAYLPERHGSHPVNPATAGTDPDDFNSPDQDHPGQDDREHTGEAKYHNHPNGVIEQAEENTLELRVEPLTLQRQRIEAGFLILEGQAQLNEEQTGIQAQVLVRLYQDAAGTQALKTADLTYSLPDGSAVAVSKVQSGNQPRLNWQARIPLKLLPKGGFWLKPVLYVDRFGIASGNLVKHK